MTKAIIMTIRPEHLFKILNGDKTIEIRKTIPKCKLPIDVYLVCSKAKPYLYTYEDIKENSDWEWEKTFFVSKKTSVLADLLNGKVVARFTLNKWEEIEKEVIFPVNEMMGHFVHTTKDFNENQLLKGSRLSHPELQQMLMNKRGYAYHIDNLVVFDEPKELGEFEKEEYAVMPNGVFPSYQPLIKAPQSWQYVWVKE
ncbi:MAG: hypothetical protein M0R51_13565 [Clostridia bacterium]|jgi:predicted transcriptional regulator|nr:hypothetical protein [Clostridia bacterium]